MVHSWHVSLQGVPVRLSDLDHDIITDGSFSTTSSHRVVPSSFGPTPYSWFFFLIALVLKRGRSRTIALAALRLDSWDLKTGTGKS